MLDFIEIILSPHMVWGGILIFMVLRFKSSFSSLLSAITDRIKNVQEYKKTKEGHEVTFSSSQASVVDKELPNVSNEPPQGLPEQSENTGWAEDNTQDINVLKQLVKTERASRYLWEYRFLNYFLVRNTQVVLDWLVSCESPPTFELFENFWFHMIPDEGERRAVIDALSRHYLIQQTEHHLIEVTPKGREYHQWRGQLPPLPEKE